MMGMMTFDTYRIVPTSMDMQMHMFHAMYGVTDWLNIMVMASYDLNQSMATDGAPIGTRMGGTDQYSARRPITARASATHR